MDSEQNISQNNPKSSFRRASFFLWIFILSGIVALILYVFQGKDDSLAEIYEFEKLLSNVPDSVSNVIPREKLTEKDTIPIISSSPISVKDVPFKYDEQASFYYRRVFQGRRINLAVVGLDSRLGERYSRADANHIISFLIDSGKIEIYSIPRDTYADAGFPDTTTFNILANYRAVKGRYEYLKQAAEIAGLDKIHHYMELSFSQAMGILNLFGFKNSNETLQVLRSRKLFPESDFQRTYNQAQFIKQMIIKNADVLESNLGSLIVRGGLNLVDTDLTTSRVFEILELMKSNGFKPKVENFSLHIRPANQMKLKQYDFVNAEVMNTLIEQAEKLQSDTSDNGTDFQEVLTNRLYKILDKAALDSANQTNNVINNLETMFKQRVWHQVADTAHRAIIRDRFAYTLAHCYQKKNKSEKAEDVKRILEIERQINNLMNKVEE